MRSDSLPSTLKSGDEQDRFRKNAKSSLLSSASIWDTRPELFYCISRSYECPAHISLLILESASASQHSVQPLLPAGCCWLRSFVSLKAAQPAERLLVLPG